MQNKEYKLKIDPRILTILSQNLYSNLYYVLSELIANAYDADAYNVYVKINETNVIVEDDGIGMDSKSIDNYLTVGYESRYDEKTSKTKLGRYKIGRKGIGKLSALSISDEYKLLTKQNSSFIGFAVKKNIKHDGKLASIDVKNDMFEFIKESKSGTRIEILNATFQFSDDIEVIAKNILKIFPILSKEFKIHLYYGNKQKTLQNYDEEIMSQLSTLTTFGKEFESLKDVFTKNGDLEFYSCQKEIESKEFNAIKTDGTSKKMKVIVKGWIGTYKTTKGRQKTPSDFPDNHISIFANGKLGEFNIMPSITTRRMAENYIIGNLHIDCFEDSTLPDMSLSNRQGYNSNDERYTLALEIIKKMLNNALNLQSNYSDKINKIKNEAKIKKAKEQEDKIKSVVNDLDVSIKNEFVNVAKIGKINSKRIDSFLDKSRKILHLKNKISEQRRKILISHTAVDKDIADIVYEMLLNNGFSKDEIIYTNADYDESRIIGGPLGYDIWEYLRDFFVRSYNDEGIYVFFIHSCAMKKSWGAVVEVGADWIVRTSAKDSCVVNINNENIENPLPVSHIRIDITRKNSSISCKKVGANSFCQIIEDVAKLFSKPSTNRTLNLNYLKKFININ